ncbi:MAG TPA: ATP-binding protein [Streptosporangiaceae bacterium]|nr:ATP-binding protein [Streptosporangiaceae bacterium]
MPAETARTSDPIADPALLIYWVILGRITLQAQPEQVREARRFITRAIGPGHLHADTAELLTSELVTNAIRHSRSGQAGGTVELIVAAKAASLLVSVIDNGSDGVMPHKGNDPGGESGNGLLLVESLSDDWGFASRAGRTVVWFLLNLSRRTN